MQCPSCGFQNLPGLTQCARCSGMLSLAEVDVQPYRAADRWVRWRHRRWRRRNAAPLTSRIASYLRDEWERSGLGTRSRGPDEPTMGERFKWIAASIIPGLGHLLIPRERRRGRWILGCYVAALLGSLLFMSSAWTIFMAIMLGIHTYAFIEAVFRRSPHAWWQPMLTSLLVLPMLMYLLYQPTAWLLAGVAQLEPLGGIVESDYLHERDVVLVPGRWVAQQQFQPGDVVSYVQPGCEGSGWYVREGASIDRILAGPGDKVDIRNSVIRVNGQILPAGQGPLKGIHIAGEHQLTVPSGAYFILPSLARLSGHYRGDQGKLETEVRMRVAVVAQDRIRGRVLAVVNPINRIRRF